MITTYFRSSSLSTYSWCEHQYFMQYVLGWRSPGNKKTCHGSIIHKVLELLARRTWCEARNITEFDDDYMGKVAIADIEPDSLLSSVYDEYVKRHLQFDWSPTDYRLLMKSLKIALEYEDGYFDPRGKDIVEPEKHFDIVIPSEWAYYKFDYKDKIIEGQLSVKGTIDLIQRIDSNTYNVIDYKHGKRLDWNTGEVKDYDKLMKDQQLLLYFWAVCQLYPQIDHFMVTIFFMRDGGSFHLPFDRKQLPEIEARLKAIFDHIKSITIPTLDKSWKCSKFCHYGTNHTKDGSTICEFIQKEILLYGIDEVVKTRSNPKFNISEYNEGGGRTK